MEIKRAQPEDLSWIACELCVFGSSLSTKNSYLPPTPEALHLELQYMSDNHVLLVAWDDGERVGTIGGIKIPSTYNPDIVILQERFWWVPERYRGSKAGYLLLRDFTKIGNGVSCVNMTLMDTSPDLDKLLRKFGYEPKEVSYVKENGNGDI